MNNGPGHVRRAALSAFVGTSLEFYDYYVYALASALVLGHVFFPGEKTTVSDIASFGTLAAGFIARPLAGTVFGILGDRWGRRRILTLTVAAMGLATMGVGLLPGYASIGVWAPILLVALRIVQGISVGGEWGGAVLMASEHATAGSKTFAASFAQLGSPAGMLLALLTFRMANAFGVETFLAWTWRIPFLLGGGIALGCYLLRRQLHETPEFLAQVADAQAPPPSSLRALSGEWTKIVYAGAAAVIGTAGFFFMNTFLLSYATRYEHIDRETILNALFIATFLQLVTQPLAAWTGERVGETRFLLTTATACAFLPYPMFLLLRTHDIWLISAGISATIVTLSAFYAVVAGYMAAAFRPAIRYTAISIAYQTSSSLISGFTPLIGTLIAARYAGQWLPLAVFFSILAGISIVGVLGLARTGPAGQ
ncbi:major facilitator superfamily alpha-ketoglutarate/sugar transporter [Komagataeibacter diospyri]|uniref:MFS transporter n=1 Tax=Komagataeibacter diospyri TaxID=1932662 RepID=UPI00113C017E|nr:MFS transporter [Komagataeibacter diospyri]GCE89130.1 major facilitator superfamily alpha-ketoglutarate/sugar transporter [Komagataeibacter diospyri]